MAKKNLKRLVEIKQISCLGQKANGEAAFKDKLPFISIKDYSDGSRAPLCIFAETKGCNTPRCNPNLDSNVNKSEVNYGVCYQYSY